MAVLEDIAAIAHESAVMIVAAAECKLSDKCRQIGSGLTHAAIGFGFLKFFFLLFVAGLGFLLWGIYRLLACSLNPPAAALVLGGAVLLIGLIICLAAVQTASR